MTIKFERLLDEEMADLTAAAEEIIAEADTNDAGPELVSSLALRALDEIRYLRVTPTITEEELKEIEQHVRCSWYYPSTKPDGSDRDAREDIARLIVEVRRMSKC